MAISVAMYLLVSIVAADLWGGLALVLEGRGSSEGFTWLTARRVYGACLLTTFGALVGASTRVLFYSSFENVDWVLGAAAVLFIADVVRGGVQRSSVSVPERLLLGKRIPEFTRLERACVRACVVSCQYYYYCAARARRVTLLHMRMYDF